MARKVSSVTAVFSDGRTHTFDEPADAWLRYGENPDITTVLISEKALIFKDDGTFIIVAFDEIGATI